MASEGIPRPPGRLLPQCLLLPLLLVLSLLVLPAIGADALKEYRVNYGRVRSRALIRLNTTSLLTSITPPSETSPTTFIDFRKGIVMYLVEDECLVARLRVGAQHFSRVLEALESPAASLPDPSTFLGPLYVSHPLAPANVLDALGPSLAPYCQGRPTWVLTVQRPRLPSYRDYLRSYSANMTNAGLSPEDDDVGRSKRSTTRRRGRSRGHRRRRYRSATGRSGRGGRRSSSRRGRRNRGASYGLDLKDLSQPVPPAAAPIETDSKGETLRRAKSPVVIAEDSHYPSLSFPRPKEDGHRFRHYRAFYTEEQDSPQALRQEDGGAVPPSLDSALNDKGDTAAVPPRAERPDTIVRDGRLFYRHDASRREEDTNEEDAATAHRRQMIAAAGGDEKGLTSASSYRPAIPASQPHQPALNTKGVDQPSFPRQTAPTGPHAGPTGSSQSPSNAHAQVHVRPGTFGASAGSLVGSQTEGGAASQVQGGASTGGFFNARSQGLGHEGGMSHSEIQGSQQGVMGSASAHRRGQQSQAQVQMSPGSSMAHAQAQSGPSSITSFAQAGRRGSHAEADSRSQGSSSSQAHVDFTTASKGDTTFSGIGLASASTRRRTGTSQSRLQGAMPIGTSYSAQGESDFSLGHVLPAHTARPHLPGDMLDSIMEKVHQQQYPSEATGESYSSQDHYTGGHTTGGHYSVDGYVIDEGGMSGGSYVQEHEVERAPLGLSRDYDEDQDSKDGVAGLATYTHGHLGAPPRPGELLDRQESLDYNGDAIFDEYGGDAYDYGEGIVDSDEEMPIIDLGPKIPGLETYDISSSLHPTAAGHNAFGVESIPQSYYPEERNFPPPPPPSSSRGDSSQTRQSPLPVQGYQQPSHHDSSTGIRDSWRRVPETSRHGPQPVLGSFDQEYRAHPGKDGRPPLVHDDDYDIGYDDDDLQGYPKIPLGQWDTHAEQRISENRDFPHHFQQSPETPPQRQPQIQPPLPLQTPRPELELPTPPADTQEDYFYAREDEDRGSSRTLDNQSFERTLPVHTQAFESQEFASRDFERDQPRLPDRRFEQPDMTHTVSRDFVNQQVSSTPTRASAASGVASHTIVQSRPLAEDDLRLPPPVENGNATSLVLPVFTDIEIPVSDYMDYDEDGNRSTTLNTSTTSTGQGGMMMMVPLEPGEPGSTHHFGPIGSGRTSLAVHTADTSSSNYDRSRFHQRPGAYLEPGDLIPGVPGYKVPNGFRGRVVLGRDQPITTESRNVAQGYNTQARLDSQSAGGQTPIFASVGGPGASKHFPDTSQDRRGIHMTLGSGAPVIMSSSSSSSSSSSGRGPTSHSSSSAAASASTSMRATSMSRKPSRRVYSYRRTVQTTGPMFQQGPGGPTGLVGASQPRHDQQQPRNGHMVESSSRMTSTQHVTSSGMSMGKSWSSSSGSTGKSWSSSSPGNTGKSWSSSSSGKSWDSYGKRGGGGGTMKGDDMCGYWSMSCKMVYGPFNKSKVCKPSHVPMSCCC